MIPLRRGEEAFCLLWIERADYLAGGSHDEASGRNDSSFGYECMGSNYRTFADDRVVEYRRSHADQAPILDRTSMNDGAMPNRNIFADCRGIHAVACMYESTTLVQPNFSVPLFPLVTCRLITEK